MKSNTEKLNTQIENIKNNIAEIPDYPEQGVSFKDITPILQSPRLFREVNNTITQYVKSLGHVDLIISPESRGFLFGPVVADRINAGFVPARKPGKLPRPIVEEPYGKEYGKDMIQIHADAIKPGQKVVIVDDVLATGGTAKAIANIVERLGGIVAGYVFFIELCYLNGTKILDNDKVFSLIQYK